MVAGAATASGGDAADMVPEATETMFPAAAWGKAGSLMGSESCICGCGDSVEGEDPAATASFSDGFSGTNSNLVSPAPLPEVAEVCVELKKFPNDRDVEVEKVEGVEMDVLILFAC